ALRPQPHGRRQRRRAHETASDGARGGGRDHERSTRFRPVGANLLRRIRRPPAEARAGENHWRVTDGSTITMELPSWVAPFARQTACRNDKRLVWKSMLCTNS